MPKIVFLNIYYQSFLDDHYKRNPYLENASYKEQLTSIQGTMFGDSDFYSHAMKELGWEAQDLIINCDKLQKQWAKENSVNWRSSTKVLVEQIWGMKPDVVYTQGTWIIKGEFLEAIRPMVKVITGHCGIPVTDFRAPQFDVLFTSIPNYVDEFRKEGVDAHYIGLGFDPRALQLPLNGDQIYPVTFVGSLSGQHKRRRHLIKSLMNELDINLWGVGFEGLPGSVLRMYHGEAWGPKMFSILRHSYITINCGIDHVHPWIGNMRMYEATGCGALLFNDPGLNMPDLFEEGKELIVYENAQDCLVKLKYYLGHEDEGIEIAKAGHARTMKDHTYLERMKYMVKKLEGKL